MKTLTLSQKEYDLVYEALHCLEAQLLIKSGRLTRIGRMNMAQFYDKKRTAAVDLMRWKFKDKETEITEW